MGATQQIGSTQRQCAYCGALVWKNATQCPKCREALPEIRQPAAGRSGARGGGDQIRRGLLYMLLAAVIYFFAGGYSALHVPYAISSVVTAYLAPLVFLSGLGLIVYGFICRFRA